MKRILFVAGTEEWYYYGPFIDACEGRGLSVYVFDSSRVPKQATVSAYLDRSGRISGFLDVLKFNGEVPQPIRLPISSIDVAWYLRENSLEELGAASLEERFAENETRTAIRSVLATLECAWINRQETVEFLASNKFYQQKVAEECGLRTPRTLLSNDPESVIAFSAKHDGLLLKSIGYIRLDDDGKHFLYSQRFAHDELADSHIAIQNCPIFSQEYIDKRCEHRVMIIGDNVLSCRIDSQASEATKVDWRHYDFDNVDHTQSCLPDTVQGQLLNFMKQLDLRYGAIDLIETPSGEFVFLEINPSGQWGWIADFATLPIPEAVADMLRSV